MKVYYNRNNFLAFKILVSAEVTGVNVSHELVSSNDERIQSQKALPILQLDSGDFISTPNDASLHLFPASKDNLNEINSWLSWESSELLPAVLAIGTKTDINGKIKRLLSKINSSLEGKCFLVANTLTVADVCIWSTLYPLCKDETLKGQHLMEMTNVLHWFNCIETKPVFQNVVAQLKIGGGIDTIQSIIESSTGEVTNSQSNLDSPNTEGSPKEFVLTDEEFNAAIEAWNSGYKSNLKNKQSIKPVLPVPGEKNILITSALPYVNNVPHLGNIIGCVLSADVFARYCRSRNYNTLYICGTDEYGTATETKALEEGLTPQQICDKYFSIHSEIYSWFNIEFDHFGRTTTPNQTEVVQQMFKACHNNGYSTTSFMEQLLCEKCNRYLADRFVEGICPRCKFEDARGDQCDGCGHLINAIELIKPRCKVCQETPVVKESQQLFLNLPKIENRLTEWLEQASEGWTSNARVISKSWLREGLKPRCITRDLKWGISVPLEGFENKVFYVWFDAPIGYMSMTKAYTEEWQKWWKPVPETSVKLYQFMAKDNVPFHSIMFPATLFASGENYILVNHLMATEYLNYEDGKFSKSRGVGVFGNDAKETGIPSDIFRFYLLYVRPESQDSSFSWADLAMKNNSELLNNLGNFVHRALMFTEKFFKNLIQAIEIGPEEKHLLALITQELKGYNASLGKVKLRDGIRYILNISRHGNQYMQSNKPWVLVKGSDSEKERAGCVVSFCCNMAGLLAVLLQPYMPQTADIMAQQLNIQLNNFIITDHFVPFFTTGHTIGKPSPLFSKIEQSTVDLLKAKYAGKQKSVSPDKINDASSNTVINSELIGELESAVSKQGEKVRVLKTSGAEKSVWQPEVEILLDLKKKLSLAQGAPEQAPSSRKKKNKK